MESLQELKIDFKVDSNKAIQNAILKLTQVITDRNSVGEREIEKMRDSFQHITSELDGTMVDTYDKTLPPCSIEHLELYQAYLARCSVPEKLKADFHKLQERIEHDLKTHPLAGAPRSGDRHGNENSYAAVKVPLGRRRQTCVMLYLNLLTGPMVIFLTCFLVMRFLPFSWYFAALYLAWVFYDNKTRGFPAPHRVRQAWRHSQIFEHFRDYFPVRLIRSNKATVFDNKKNFLFCYHPHGVQSAGAFAFASAACGFDELFPGLTACVQTLPINFNLPLMRENVIALGIGNASKSSLLNTLSPDKPGFSAVLVTGGAYESMYAQPYTSKVVLKSRAGFVKVALQSGASLVPVWGFGENNLYENLAAGSPRILRWQRKIQRMISFAPLLVAGRGVFTYSGGLLPRRRPISVVIGDPIHVGAPDPNPSNERINEVHQKYKDAVLALFNKYKDIYDPKAAPIELI
mmetsp:Transcript_7172/g.13583  ORF Transcript_7172/g.13583 Transcript_7172/m.13583 type:complete len:461 (+) Transcript_7172:40-1422(+)